MKQNRIEKIAQRFAVGLEEGHVVRSGDYLSISPAHVMTHDNSGAVIAKFLAIGSRLGRELRVAKPRQIVFALDHNIQDQSQETRDKYSKIEAFARQMGIDFYPAGRGIGHQIMCEEGYAWPGTLVVASDSHANTYGGLGCLGTPVVRTDAAAIWATGRTWWQVPPVARVELTGSLRPGVAGKDVILTLCGTFNRDEVLNCAVEFHGEGVGSLSIDQRLTIANMTTEWGALAGVFPVDSRTQQWLRQRLLFLKQRGPSGVASDADGNDHHPRVNAVRISELAEDRATTADEGCHYAVQLEVDLASVEPQVSGPDNVKVMTPVSQLSRKNIPIQKAYLVSCVNSRVDDLAEAAKVLEGRKVAAGVEFYVAAASSEVQRESECRGDWQTLLQSGALALPPGCGPCIGLGAGLLEDGEVGISATNRNFKGRMGSRNAQAYLASPAVVAASAAAGKIESPENLLSGEPRTVSRRRKISSVVQRSQDTPKKGQVRLMPGFPEIVQGELVFCFQDNLNTDGIFPGKYTYIDDFTPQQQASVAMENYDPAFQEIVQSGDILVGGFNFGTGSSREQAATALKYRGLRFVIAGSFSETYKRNALNNGFLLVEAPGLVRNLKETFGNQKPSVRTGVQARLIVRSSQIETTDARGRRKVYSICPIGRPAQELILQEGLEGWVVNELTKD